jgi:class 3 adenylate cyclase/tetratricopeptide (TPR) repeat protein
MPVCPSCGEESLQGSRFCPSCGAQLSDAEPPREERKVVSVVFCDLVGSTAAAERMDPEDVRARLSHYHARVRAELERFGGTVEKFIGDAVVALFGAPLAHEDDPERAVRAALAIRDWVAEEADLHVRIAVNTGEALVALGARPAEGEGMASGDVVNTAARLQSAAPVDGILVGEQTYRATERMIEYRETQPVVAKGKSEPVPVWEVVQARSRFGVDVTRDAATPLVGREREVEVLVAALDRAVEERAPQLVTLVGVPGIGKSRLLAELFASIDRGGRLTFWRQGRSLPYGEGVSFWALGEMVKAQAGILETDAEEEAARKLAEAVERLLPDTSEARWVESHLRPLAGLASEEGAADRRGEAFAAWRRFFEGLAEERPLVLVFEDLHWADDGLLDFVDELVDRLTDVPVLVVGSARPELLARRPAWGGGKANATTLSLPPLSDDETARLVHTLLERSVLPAEVQTMLLERAGGNPLYAEEFVRMVAERGAEELELPESVQGIIAARLDALPAEDKELLQHAAVVGKVFWSGALGGDRFDVEERLHALERRELVRRERRSSVEGESEYAFRHVLVRDVAYGTIPRAARAERHRLAAEWIEALGRPDDHADLLAHHYLSALELARAAGVDAGVLTTSAAAALQRAGERAFALNDFAAATRFYDEALTLGVADADRPHVLFRHAAALHMSSEEGRIEALEQARDALLAAGDVETGAEATALLAEACWHGGRPEEHRAALAQAQELVQGRPASPAVARVLAQSARYAMLGGRYEEAVAVGNDALAMAEALGLGDVACSALNSIGSARGQSGDGAGIAELERAIELGLAAKSPDTSRAYHNLAVINWSHKGVAAAYELVLKASDVAEQFGNAAIRRFTEAVIIEMQYDLGRWDEALRGADAFIAECESGSPNYNEATLRGLRARILLARDDVVGAEAEAARGLELARAIGEPQALIPSLAVNVLVLEAAGRAEEARSLADEVRDFYRQGSIPYSFTAALVFDRIGRRDEFGSVLERQEKRGITIREALAVLEGDYVGAADMAAAEGALTLEAETRVAAARAFVEAGRRADADEQLAKALAFFRSVGATRYVREGEALLAATA